MVSSLQHSTNKGWNFTIRIPGPTMPVIIGFVAVLAVFFFFAPDARADWTMMVYLDGDNNLGESDHDQTDFDEIEAYGGSNVDVVVLWDDHQDGDTNLYHRSGGSTSELHPAWLDTEESMGDGDTLSDFVDWSLTNYPSSHTFFVFWDHGAGCWGCCRDEINGTSLRMEEIRDALDAALGVGEKFDLVGFAACSMASTEVAYEMEEYADFMLASEKTAWLNDDYGFHWDFEQVLDEMDSNNDPSSVAEFLADQAFTSSITNHAKRSHTWEVLDLGEIPGLVTELNGFSEQLINYFPEYYIEIAWARMGTEEYKPGERADLYHFAENIHGDASLPAPLRNAAHDVMDAIDDAVVVEYHQTGTEVTMSGYYEHTAGDEANDADEDEKKEEYPCDHAHGLNIYFPVNRTGWYPVYTGSSKGVEHFADDSSWDEWISLFSSYIFVDDDSSGFEDGSIKYPFGTIHGGLDVAVDGDTIRVFEGNYPENVYVGTAVEIVANGTVSVIEPASGTAIDIGHTDVNVSHFYIHTPTGDNNIVINVNGADVSWCTLSTSGGHGILVDGGDDCNIENCTVLNAGDAGICLDDADNTRIVNCEIHDCTNDGIYVYDSQDVEISFCRVHDNGQHGVGLTDASDTTIWDNDICDNGDHGVHAKTDSTGTDARFNYWGDPTGPGGAGPGYGDKVTEYVEYSPWLGDWAGTLPQTFYVDDTGLIQAAVDHATPGDSVEVYYGTYQENVDVYKTLTISGRVDIPPYPVIHPTSGDAVFITAPWVTIQRFYIHTGTTGDNDIHIGSEDGGGDHATIYMCELGDSGEEAIYFHYVSDNCLVDSCEIHDAGSYGIRMHSSMDLTASYHTIRDTSIHNSTLSGIRIDKDCMGNTITGCEIYSNGEAGVYNEGDDTQVLYTEVYNNTKDGVALFGSDHTTVKWCGIYDNAEYGVSEHSGASNTDAGCSYWGHWSGPGGSGPRSGDEVSASVRYAPWLGYAVGTSPRTFHVDTTGEIQWAVDNATEGDTIRVHAGFYTENLQVDKSLDLVGNGSAGTSGNNSAISAGDSGDAVRISSTWVNMTGFYLMTGTQGDNCLDIRTGHVTVWDCTMTTSGGDAVQLNSADQCVIRDCVIEGAGNHGIALIGLFLYPFPLDCDGNVIENCTVSGSAGDGIWIDDYCNDNVIDGCEVYGNADSGVGLRGGTNTVTGCVVHNNTGDGVSVNGSSHNEVSDCDIHGNDDDGIFLSGAGNTTVSSCDIHGNGDDGAAFSGSDGNTFSHCQIRENGDKGAYLASSDDNLFSRCTIRNNTGYGVFADYFFSQDTSARFCYWGASDGPGGYGPGSGDEISSNVAYSPWLASPGGRPHTTFVVDWSGMIQDALDESDEGDTIKVWNGTFFERLRIPRRVNLIGNGSKHTVINGGPGPGGTDGPGGPGGQGGAGGRRGAWGPPGGEPADVRNDGPPVDPGAGDVVLIPPGVHGVHMGGFHITGGGPGEKDAGLKVMSDGNEFFDILCTKNRHGISLDRAHHNLLHGVVCRENERGISLHESHDNTVENGTFAANQLEGIVLARSDRNSLLGNEISGNSPGILVKDMSAQNRAHYNKIDNNRDYGIRVLNNEGKGINATRNWWGGDSGPYHPTLNPKRKDPMGGNVTDGVEFSPWLDGRGSLVYAKEGQEEEEKEEAGGFLPGYEAILLPAAMSAAAAAAIVLSRRSETRRR